MKIQSLMIAVIAGATAFGHHTEARTLNFSKKFKCEREYWDSNYTLIVHGVGAGTHEIFGTQLTEVELFKDKEIIGHTYFLEAKGEDGKNKYGVRIELSSSQSQASDLESIDSMSIEFDADAFVDSVVVKGKAVPGLNRLKFTDCRR